MKALTLLTILSLLSASAIAKDISEISELSGYTLGEKIYPNSDGINQCAENNMTCWGVNRDLSPASYNVQVNINSRREIFRIYATQAIENPNTLEQCLSRANRVVKGFKRTYGVEFDSKEWNDTMTTSFSWQNKNIEASPMKISISCKRISIPGMPAVNSVYVLGVSIAHTGIMDAS
ncbi:MAG: hypothetical protein AB7Q04_14100 [Steroidobacteraceae bacterium]